MRTIFGGLRGRFLVIPETTPSHVLEKKSVMQALAPNILMGISIVKIVCECFCHDRKTGHMLEFFNRPC